SSVGELATDTLIADSNALATGSSSDDTAYQATEAALQRLADDRDVAAAQIKKVLSAAAHGTMPHPGQATRRPADLAQPAGRGRPARRFVGAVLGRARARGTRRARALRASVPRTHCGGDGSPGGRSRQASA